MPENTEKDIRKFKDEIFVNMKESFDLLHNTKKLELFLSLLTEEQKDKLYTHPLVDLKDGYDLLP